MAELKFGAPSVMTTVGVLLDALLPSRNSGVMSAVYFESDTCWAIQKRVWSSAMAVLLHVRVIVKASDELRT